MSFFSGIASMDIVLKKGPIESEKAHFSDNNFLPSTLIKSSNPKKGRFTYYTIHEYIHCYYSYSYSD